MILGKVFDTPTDQKHELANDAILLHEIYLNFLSSSHA